MNGKQDITFVNPHEILDGYDSLLRHHKAKEDIRHHQLDLIPLKKDDLVLDIGIGTGLYLPHWLSTTKSLRVKFDLFDISKEALSVSLDKAKSVGEEHRIRTIEADFSYLEQMPRETYNVIFLGNTIEYIENPTQFIQEKLMPLLKKGGLLVIRDLDCSFMSCSTTEASLNKKIVRSRIRNNEENSKIEGSYQNPFIGKDLSHIVQSSGLTVIQSYKFDIVFNGPITGWPKEYLSRLHMTWYVDDLLGILSAEDKENWSNYFNESHPMNVFDHESTRYEEAEYMVIGQKK